MRRTALGPSPTVEGHEKPGSRCPGFLVLLYSVFPGPLVPAPAQRGPTVRLQGRRPASAPWTSDAGDGGRHPFLLRDQGAEALLSELDAGPRRRLSGLQKVKHTPSPKRARRPACPQAPFRRSAWPWSFPPTLRAFVHAASSWAMRSMLFARPLRKAGEGRASIDLRARRPAISWQHHPPLKGSTMRNPDHPSKEHLAELESWRPCAACCWSRTAGSASGS